ncbi:MAG: hypothetical protein IIW48_13280 [Clostridia bacterium]|nr:hypothetical protein [Clostridia bacterium]
MFEFYRIVVNPDSQKEEIKKFQYEETPETIELKEKFQKAKDEYEEYEVTYVEWYYHTHREEKSFPMSLSESVFREDKFVGCMRNGVFIAVDDQERLVFEQKGQGAQVETNFKIRRR